MKMKQKLGFIALMLLLLSLVACSGVKVVDDAESGEATTDPSGEQSAWDMGISNSDFAEKKLTMLNIWASWCGPCISELPELQQLSETYADKDVQVVGVLQDGVDEAGLPNEGMLEEIGQALVDMGITYRMILPDETLQDDFIAQMQYFPTTFFIDSNGEVVRMEVGAKDANEWGKIIDEILEDLE